MQENLYFFVLEKVRVYRYLEIMHDEGLEISQPALDPESLEIHHRITLRNSLLNAHKYVYNPSDSLVVLSF